MHEIQLNDFMSEDKSYDFLILFMTIDYTNSFFIFAQMS